MIIVNVSGTRKDIRWLIKNIKREKNEYIAKFHSKYESEKQYMFKKF